jgi:large subunit ribosomal protein L29
MKASEIRDLTEDVLQKRLNDSNEELMKLRFQQASGQRTDTSRLRDLRRDIARMTMVLAEQRKAAKVEGEK